MSLRKAIEEVALNEEKKDTLNESFKRFAGNKNNNKPIYYRIFHKTNGDYHSSGESIHIPMDMVKEFKQLINKLK